MLGLESRVQALKKKPETMATTFKMNIKNKQIFKS